MSHIFISYSKKDIEFARYVKRSLEEAGFVVWMDETAMRPSTRWWPTIERNIETGAAVVVLMSPHSRDSDWVEREILYAERLGKSIFPVLLAGEDWPRLANIQFADMTSGIGCPLPDSLLDGLNAVILPSKSADLAATTPESLPGPLIPESAPARRSGFGRGAWLTGAAVIVLLVIVGVIIAAMGSGDDGESDDSGAHVTITATGQGAALAETSTPDLEGTVAASVQQTQDAINTQNAPTLTPTASLTVTLSPSATSAPTATPTATLDVSPTPRPTDTPEPISDPGRAAAMAIGLDPAATLIPDGVDNTSWRPQFQTVNELSVAYVPGGCFIMGLDSGEVDEKPAHRACLSPFWIGVTEITNAQYAACVDAGACSAPQNREYYGDAQYDNYPVVYVSWQQASEYAAWVGGSLSTEAQWEYAARGPSSWNYPWGNLQPSCERAILTLEGCESDLAPVGGFERPSGQSWVGAQDMAGSVWEYVTDWYSDTAYTATDAGLDPTGPATGSTHVIRGGGWSTGVIAARSSYRNYRSNPAYFGDDVGFRVVIPVAAE